MNDAVINFSDLVEANGKTIRQNNLEKPHAIAVGSLVQINYGKMQGVCLFVVNHSRDCDGTPLYDLSYNKDAQKEFEKFEQDVKNGAYDEDPYGHALKLHDKGKFFGMFKRNYAQESLIVIREPQEDEMED